MKYLSNQEQTVLWLFLCLFLMGVGVKVYREVNVKENKLPQMPVN